MRGLSILLGAAISVAALGCAGTLDPAKDPVGFAAKMCDAAKAADSSGLAKVRVATTICAAADEFTQDYLSSHPDAGK